MSSGLIELIPRNSETDWSRFSVSVIPEASLFATTNSNQDQQQRCQYCKKKMKKPYKHRNGKCLEPKSKSSARPKCAYCHQSFSNSKGIPSHLRNSCRVYRQVCEAKGISLPEAEQSSSPYDTSSAPSETPEPPKAHRAPLPAVLNAKATIFDQKAKLKPTKASNLSLGIVCQYCGKKFLKKASLKRHLQKQCLVWVRKQTQSLANMPKPTTEVTASPLPPPEPSSLDDKSAIDQKDTQQEQLEQQRAPSAVVEEITKCVYCQQDVSKKSRFLHHNGRCVLGRVNAEYPCPNCPAAFMTRTLLLKHRCDPALKRHGESATENAETSAAPTPECPQRRLTKPTPKQLALVKQKSPVKQPSTPRKQIIDSGALETPTSIVKREFCSHCRQRIKDSERKKHEEKRCFNNNDVTYNCGYCRKGFAARESLIEHQRVCTVRKQHKQVKCQFCGLMISNRGNLKKHQKVYCKAIKRDDEVTSENPDKADKSQTSDSLQKPAKPPKPDKPPKSEKPIKSEKPVKLKKVNSEEPVKKKIKIKKEKPTNAKIVDEDMEDIPLKQRKLYKSKPKPSEAANATKKLKNKPVTNRKKAGGFSCEYCNRKFELESKLRKHGHTCTIKRSTLTLICPHCSTPFSKRGNLDRHLRLKCKNIDRDKSVLNQTISDLVRPDTPETMNSTVENNEEDNKEEPLMESTEEDPKDLPIENPLSNNTAGSEPSRTEPAMIGTSRTSEEPAEILPTSADSPQAPTAHEEVDEIPEPIDDEVPEPIEEEVIIPEEILPATDDEPDAMCEQEDSTEVYSAEQTEEAPPDEVSDNNNAERDKATLSPQIEQEPAPTVSSVNEKHDDSTEHILPDCETEQETEPEPESEPVEPMQVDNSTI